mgnify:CR=1 FL=1|jgi:hypothetical protein|tara:strand:- start:3273 stop:3992 length:720 start_codon:yes stop_codon:yes gene_type:complete
MIPLTHLTHQEIGVTEPGEFVFMRPFGPAVGHTTLPPELIEAFRRDMGNGAVPSPSHNPASDVIRSERPISQNILQEFLPFFTEAAINYVGQYASRHCLPVREDIWPEARIHAAWYVRQKSGDFAPFHPHMQDDSFPELSAVGYLQTPTGLVDYYRRGSRARVGRLADHHGCIEFTHGKQTYLTRDSCRVQPKAGDFFIFPSDLVYMLYPFSHREERHSFTLNINLDHDQKDNGDGDKT